MREEWKIDWAVHVFRDSDQRNFPVLLQLNDVQDFAAWATVGE